MAETKKSSKKKATPRKKKVAKQVTYQDLLQSRHLIATAESELADAKRRYRRAQAQDGILRKAAMLNEATPALQAAQAKVGAAQRDFYELKNRARKERHG